MYDELIRDLGGRWSRPFVTDGDPIDVQIAVVGLNPATPLSPDEFPREHYTDLLTDRTRFEAEYRRIRAARGKGEISPTRRRLSLLVAAYAGFRVTETNVNAFPTKDSAELARAEFRRDGEEIATNYLSRIRPTLVVVHGADALRALGARRILKINTSISEGPFHRFVEASWLGRPLRCVLVRPHLVARDKGWRDEEISRIAEVCRP